MNRHRRTSAERRELLVLVALVVVLIGIITRSGVWVLAGVACALLFLVAASVA